MTVKAIYADGVFRPQGPVALEERTEVEIEIKTKAPALGADESDPRSFVGFIKNAPAGVALARDHDDHLDDAIRVNEMTAEGGRILKGEVQS